MINHLISLLLYYKFHVDGLCFNWPLHGLITIFWGCQCDGCVRIKKVCWYHITLAMYRIVSNCDTANPDLFSRGAIIKSIKMLNLNYYLFQKIWHPETITNIRELHVQCPIDEIMLF